MAFIRREGLTKSMLYTPPVSTSFTTNCAVVFSTGSGTVIPATTASTTLLGVYEGPNVTTAATSPAALNITVPRERAVEWTVDVEAGTLATTSIGSGFALNDAMGVNQGSQAAQPVTCTQFLTTTKGIFVINTTL